MADRVRPDIARAAGVLERTDARPSETEGPSSSVRPVDAGGPIRALHIATRLRGLDAEGALVTVTDAAGTVHYEGPLRSDGTACIELAGVRGATWVRVLLETACWHRQADVFVVADVTEHGFA